MSKEVHHNVAAEVLNKLMTGDKIEDSELASAINTLESIVDFLDAGGDVFFLSWKYLNAKLSQLKEFRTRRKKK